MNSQNAIYIYTWFNITKRQGLNQVAKKKVGEMLTDNYTSWLSIKITYAHDLNSYQPLE